MTRFISIILLLTCACWVPSSSAQEKTSRKQDSKAKQQTPLSVKLNLITTDANFQTVADVPKERLRIYEDDVPQTLTLFEEKAKPAGFVLAIDTSLSLRREIMIVIATARLIVESAAPDEQIMLVKFISSDKIERLQDFTADHGTLLKAIDGVFLEGGQSAILDALSISIDSIVAFTKDKGNVRRPVIIITDGEDRHSYFTQHDLSEQIQKTGAQVMAIAFQQDLQPPKSKERATNLLNHLTLQSGGDVFFPNSVGDIKEDVKQIMMEIRAPYVVGYESSKPARDGKYRKVRVEVENPPGRPPRLAFVRSGYTAPKE